MICDDTPVGRLINSVRSERKRLDTVIDRRQKSNFQISSILAKIKRLARTTIDDDVTFVLFFAGGWWLVAGCCSIQKNFRTVKILNAKLCQAQPTPLSQLSSWIFRR